MDTIAYWFRQFYKPNLGKKEISYKLLRLRAVAIKRLYGKGVQGSINVSPLYCIRQLNSYP